jgi:adenosylhomocysteine nucleosidase
MNRPILFLTAIDVERRAVLEHLTDRHDVTERGTRFLQARTVAGRHRAVLAQTGQGNAGSTLTAQQAIARFQPGVVVFSGIAGALQPHLNFADVVVADQITAFGGGLSEDDGFRARPRSWQVPHAEQQFARDLAESSAWKEHRPGQCGRVMVGHIASGEVVLNSRRSELAQQLERHHNDALAIEMEGAGVARAAHTNGVPFMIVRAISDRADGTKYTTDRGDTQRQAAEAAAAFAVLLGDGLAARRPEEPAGRPGRGQGDQMNQPIHQNVGGNAQVGNMVGVIHGNMVNGLHQEQAAQTVRAELEYLRGLLQQALDDGRLSSAEHRDAAQRLADAESVVPPEDPEQRGIALWTLRKLLEIVGGVADLGDYVNRIIASISRMAS